MNILSGRHVKVKKKSWIDPLVNYDVIMPVLLICFVITFIINVFDLPTVAKRMPLLVGFITLFFLVIEAVRAVRKALGASVESENIIKSIKFLDNKALQFVCVMFLYGVGIYAFGYLVPTAVMLMVTIRMLGEKRISRILLVSAGFLAVFYLTFIGLFGLYMPKGVFL
jgi:hypothetical protein